MFTNSTVFSLTTALPSERIHNTNTLKKAEKYYWPTRTP